MAVTIKDGYFTWTRDDHDDRPKQTSQTRNASTGSLGRKEGLLEDSEHEPKLVEFILSDLNLTIRSVSLVASNMLVGLSPSPFLFDVCVQLMHCYSYTRTCTCIVFPLGFTTCMWLTRACK